MREEREGGEEADGENDRKRKKKSARREWRRVTGVGGERGREKGRGPVRFA